MKLRELKKISSSFNMIFEAKEDWIVQNMGQRLLQSAERERGMVSDPHQIITQLKQMDPTNGKYLVFLAKMYADKQFRLEDANRIKETLTTFERVKPRLVNKDIMSYKTLSDLYDALTPFEQTEAPVSQRQQVKGIKETGAKKIMDTPDFKVIQPVTQEAACFYGAGTKWCTAGKTDNMFDHYNKQGPLYIIMAGGRKFQLHYESSQFTNERDQEVSATDIALLSKYPQYKQFLNMLISKHYGL